MNHHKTHQTARPNMCAKYYIWPYLDSRVKNYDQISFLAVFPIFTLHLSKMILFLSLPKHRLCDLSCTFEKAAPAIQEKKLSH